ncbi:MAG: hypothetical protein ACFFB8_18415 [Promethearchaeota archaeon]
MSSDNLLKYLLIIGGIIEFLLGILFMFLSILLKQFGRENIPIFTQMAGVFVFCYGILLIYSTKDIEKYLIILLVNILIRIIVIIFSLLSLFEYPEFSLILLFAIPYDLLWSLSIIILLKKSGLIFRRAEK